ncbi:glycosyltransferase family 2 protein [Luteirhabdus pelagi]|uniref:glycosyltransferase family 2 protein n=1 Tax=Luteirhabdus pelagi TaxID=2792783 RepID=UPI001939AE60|nr:glycosyltransferase family 2 protein [Luteirhabdus pelagi]
MPRISIITVNYNDAEGLQKTMDSVLGQSFSDFEYVVIDGGSSDNSAQVIEERQRQLAYWVSEADTGVYEAMNKGLRQAKGDYVLFLNSGDRFHSTEVLERVAPALTTGEDILYGNMVFQGKNTEFLREYPDTLTFQYFLERSIPHPAAFIQRSLFDQLFYYSEVFKIVSDWEFFIYAVCIKRVSYRHIPETISIFQMDGLSNDPKNAALMMEEKMKVYRNYFQPYYETALQHQKLTALMQTEEMRLVQTLRKDPAGKKWMLRGLRWLSKRFSKKDTN